MLFLFILLVKLLVDTVLDLFITYFGSLCGLLGKHSCLQRAD